MDPIYPWLDPIEVRRLADRLMMPNREPAVTVTDAGFDEGFVGYASEQTVPQAAPISPPPPPVVQAASSPPHTPMPCLALCM